MDAIDPEVIDLVEQITRNISGVLDVHDTRVRWHGHRLLAELHIVVDEDLSTRESHQIAEDVRHNLFHEQPRMTLVTVHVDPSEDGGAQHHTHTMHHAASIDYQTQPA